MSRELRMKLVDENDIPVGATTRSKWLKALKQIPKGKSWIVKDGDLSIKATTMKRNVLRYIKKGLLPKCYKIRQQVSNGKLTVYILNANEGQAGRGEDK